MWHYDLIEVFEMIKGISKVEYEPFFKLEQIGTRTRGHNYKLVKNRARLDIRKNYLVTE